MSADCGWLIMEPLADYILRQLANRFRFTAIKRVDSADKQRNIIDCLGLHPYNHVQFFENIRDDVELTRVYLETIHTIRIRVTP